MLATRFGSYCSPSRLEFHCRLHVCLHSRKIVTDDDQLQHILYLAAFNDSRLAMPPRERHDGALHMADVIAKNVRRERGSRHMHGEYGRNCDEISFVQVCDSLWHARCVLNPGRGQERAAKKLVCSGQPCLKW